MNENTRTSNVEEMLPSFIKESIDKFVEGKMKSEADKSYIRKSLGERLLKSMQDQTTYTAIEMAKRLMVDSIWKSANLEGLGTTFPKTEAILENIPTNTKTEEVLFIVNMKRAWNFLLDNIDAHNDLSFIRELNKIVGNNLFRFAGDLRTIPVSIGGTSWEPDMPHQGIILEELDKINLIEDVKDKSTEIFCFIARSQMFIDGNKRVAQLMANKVLIENNIGIFQIPIEKIEAFKMELIKFYETNDNTNIKNLMMDCCIKELPRECLNKTQTTKKKSKSL